MPVDLKPEEEMPRNHKVAIWEAVGFIFLLWLYYSFLKPTTTTFIVVAILVFVLFIFIHFGLSYSGEKSKLYGLKPLVDRLPVIKKPEAHIPFNRKMLWLIVILLFYFVLTNVMIYGLDPVESIDLFASWRAILAGAQGSILHLGIGPIVTGSIIMQLFVGAKIINLNLKDKEDKAIYQSTQKLIVIIMIFVEAVPQVYGYLQPAKGFVSSLDGYSKGNGLLIAQTLIIAQIVFGSYLVFLMDEVVSKWAIGSGISLFIAAGVAQAIFTGTFNWLPTSPTKGLSFDNPPAGTIPKTIYFIQNMNAGNLAGGGFEQMFLQAPNPILALIGTFVIFLVVAYVESTKIELPLAHGKARGARGRYPIRLMYASNIPVILMAAVLANVAMFSLLLWNQPVLSTWPVIGHQTWIGSYPTRDVAERLGISVTTPTDGIAYYLSSVNGVQEWFLPLINPDRYSGLLRGREYWQVLLHVISYLGAMVVGSIFFAKFWIETTNMDAEAVAKQIESSGMLIPGFRRDPRVLRLVLQRYIPQITVISGAAVGALAAIADMIGTVGNASGTGLLLTVGILINLYEAMGREQLMEMHPVLRQFFS